MTVDVVIEDDRWLGPDLSALCERAVPATLARLGLEDAAFEVCVLGCDDARIGVLNGDFRGKPVATNVLSWPSAERGVGVDGETPLPPDPVDPELGDIAIAYETCAAQADAAGIALKDHVTHLIVHATLHLLGYDHERSGDAALMEGLEVEILGNLSISDPYRS